jgi:hypothetical protein
MGGRIDKSLTQPMQDERRGFRIDGVDRVFGKGPNAWARLLGLRSWRMDHKRGKFKSRDLNPKFIKGGGVLQFRCKVKYLNICSCIRPPTMRSSPPDEKLILFWTFGHATLSVLQVHSESGYQTPVSGEFWAKPLCWIGVQACIHCNEICTQ